MTSLFVLVYFGRLRIKRITEFDKKERINMKILTVSDTVEPFLYQHFDSAKAPQAALILSCGDLPPEYLSFLGCEANPGD